MQVEQSLPWYEPVFENSAVAGLSQASQSFRLSLSTLEVTH